MTDLKTMRAMLERAGIIYKLDEEVDGWTLTVIAHEGEHNIGYGEFFSQLTFNTAGNLIEWGCWE